MEFRWVALIAVWTLVSGPILGTRSGPATGERAKQVKIVKPLTKDPARR